MAGGLSKATVRHTPPVALSPSAFPFFWALSPVWEDGQAGLAVQVAGWARRAHTSAWVVLGYPHQLTPLELLPACSPRPGGVEGLLPHQPC